MTVGVSVVAHQWYHDTSIPQLIFNVLHVYWVWEKLDRCSSSSVFVLRLHQDNRATISDLRCCKRCAEVRHIATTDQFHP